jgi:SAM-dependent methyltransferase
MNKKSIDFLDLGSQPLANSYLTKKNLHKKEKKYRLIVCFNKENKIVSIKKTFSSKEMFTNKYPYRSSASKTMSDHLKKLANNLKKMKVKKILEIGSNDGCFIKNFNKKKTIGIEPCANVESITKKKNYNTFPEYWSKKLAKKILKKHKKVNLVFSSNTISHIKNLDEVFEAINIVLDDKGILIIEDPSLLQCLKKNTFDQFYNEHIYVFSYLALNNVLKKHNLQVYKIEEITIHGGSNRYFIKKKSNKINIDESVNKYEKKEKKYGLEKLKTYFKFANRVKSSKKKLISIFKNCKKNNKKVIGYGATAKSTTILNYCNLDKLMIGYFLDTTKDKQNKYTPGTKIPILKYTKPINNDVDYIFLGAWNFKEEIFKKEKKYIKNGGKFIIHTPYPKII